jgi:2-methylcitrate synthase/citrate synthase II
MGSEQKPQELIRGLEGIAAGETAVSSLDGGLSYRGYAVEDLAKNATYEDVAYLLLHGHAADKQQMGGFRERIASATTLPDEFWRCLYNLPRTSVPMDVLRTGVSLLAAWDPDAQDNSAEAELRKSERLLGQIAVVLAGWWRISQEEAPLDYDPKQSLAANLLRMIRGDEPMEHETRALDVSLILYAEHEFNASTFTARVVASTLSDLHSAITAAIGALKGPLHGGANERVLEVLQEVGSPERAESWIRTALVQKRKIMGFGHRVYKVEDPRATLLKSYCVDLATRVNQLGMEEMADTIERIIRDEKHLPANADWPSGRLYHYLRLPVPLYTPLFVASRVAGWAAHVMEQHADNRIIRPSALYTGPAVRPWRS